jgi:hypothetical protein
LGWECGLSTEKKEKGRKEGERKRGKKEGKEAGGGRKEAFSCLFV